MGRAEEREHRVGHKVGPVHHHQVPAVVDDDLTHFVSALRISSGKVRWTRTSDADQDELSVGSGVVVHGVYVFEARTGRLRFVMRPSTGSEPRTLVVKGTLFRNNQDTVEAWLNCSQWRAG